jgi:glycine/D-amino acid oxidase-like deaminating enzyme/nitrite reductase/ring-hydroxylating ferredoxin subunit
MTTTSYWLDSANLPHYTKLDKDLHVDVVVVGGGITGITAAYLLKKAGRTVALLERDRCAHVDTGHTTAHLTYVTDQRLSELVSHFGRDHAQAVWDAGRAAIEQIHDIIRRENIACDFTWVPGYLHASLKETKRNDRTGLKNEAELARELGFEGAYVEAVPLFQRPGIRFSNQAKFHPLKYLARLVQEIPGAGSHVFEESEVSEVGDEPLTVHANGHSIQCDFLVVATHVPLMGKTNMVSATLLQTKLALYSTYVIGGKLSRGVYPEASFWDTSDPYYYLRIDRHAGHDYAIFGGEDHKTGQQTDTEAPLDNLERLLKYFLPEVQVDHRWSGQVIETNDGLPYMGQVTERQFVATGYSGNGMTFGTLAGMMACDAALGTKNPWAELFDVRRKKLRGGTWDYLKENIDYPYYMIKDRLTASEDATIHSVQRGEGKILKIDGERVAAYRDPDGNVTTLSSVCTHMGCIVHWNKSESTWDCPCHGSRFGATGEVLAGPAETPLEKVDLEKEASEAEVSARSEK